MTADNTDSIVTAETALALLREFQAAEADLNRLEQEVTRARERRDRVLGALRMYGTGWEQRR